MTIHTQVRVGGRAKTRGRPVALPPEPVPNKSALAAASPHAYNANLRPGRVGGRYIACMQCWLTSAARARARVQPLQYQRAVCARAHPITSARDE